MGNRRNFLKGLAAVWPAGLLWPRSGLTQGTTQKVTLAPARDYFKELGVQPFINAIGPYSTLGGAPMWPEVIKAMDYAMTHKAKMKELHDAVGERIAALLGSEAAMVSAGATSAITLGTAACITMGDGEKIKQIPDVAGLKHEVLIQKSHRYSYDHAIRVAGGTLVEVETADDVRRAVNERTAMMHFLMTNADDGEILIPEFVALGKELGVATFCDAATIIPPFERLNETVTMGFDLVCFSGGKGLRGPYSAGLLLGRRDLVAAARLNSAPNNDTIGRGMKVSKEELLGTLVAVETSLKSDYQTERERNHRRIDELAAILSDVPTVVTTKFLSKGEGSDPYLQVDWDDNVIKISREDFKTKLRDGEPSIEISAMSLSKGRIHLSTRMMEEGEVRIVGETLKGLLLLHS